jgi:hypothetical protein
MVLAMATAMVITLHWVTSTGEVWGLLNPSRIQFHHRLIMVRKFAIPVSLRRQSPRIGSFMDETSHEEEYFCFIK